MYYVKSFHCVCAKAIPRRAACREKLCVSSSRCMMVVRAFVRAATSDNTVCVLVCVCDTVRRATVLITVTPSLSLCENYCHFRGHDGQSQIIPPAKLAQASSLYLYLHWHTDMPPCRSTTCACGHAHLTCVTTQHTQKQKTHRSYKIHYARFVRC